MRSTFVKTLCDVAKRGVDVHLLTADLGFKVLDPFREQFPKRFTNMGVAEANMVSVASGMALLGKRVVCYSMVPFLFMRAFEQVRLDVVAAKLPVVLVGVGGGLSYGHEGVSHHALEDVAMARSLPGLRVIAPGDPIEADAALRYALSADGPTFLRLGKNGDPIVQPNPIDDIGRLRRIGSDAGDIAVLATGHILADAAAACATLEAAGLKPRLFSVPTLKPLDDRAIRAIAKVARAVITIEEHSVVGGLGSAVAEVLLEEGYSKPFLKLGLPDAYCETHGSHDWLRRHYQLDAPSLARRIQEVIS